MARPEAWRSWCDEAVRRIDADFARSADTHLLRVDIPGVPDCPLYLKDESVHPTGSLKHRLARSLFLYGLVQRPDRPAHDGGRGVIGFDRGLRGVLRAADRRAFRRGHAPIDLSREDRADRIPWRPLPPGGFAVGGVRRGRGAGRTRRRALHGPVHLRRAGDRLARQQQHRRIDLRADAHRAVSGTDVDRRRRRHRRHQFDTRALCALPPLPDADRSRRSREFGVPRLLPERRRIDHAARGVAYRRHRPPARRAELQPARDRPFDPRAGRGFVCSRTVPRECARSQGRPVDGHGTDRLRAAAGRDEARAHRRRGRDAAVRRWRTLPRDVLRRRLAAGAGL